METWSYQKIRLNGYRKFSHINNHLESKYLLTHQLKDSSMDQNKNKKKTQLYAACSRHISAAWTNLD